MFQFIAPRINETYYEPELKRRCISKDLNFSIKFDFNPTKTTPLLPLIAAKPVINSTDNMMEDDGYDFMSDDPSDSDEAECSDFDSDLDDMPMKRNKAKIYK